MPQHQEIQGIPTFLMFLPYQESVSIGSFISLGFDENISHVAFGTPLI